MSGEACLSNVPKKKEIAHSAVLFLFDRFLDKQNIILNIFQLYAVLTELMFLLPMHVGASEIISQE